jgi:signal peptidase I, archaeal type
MGEKNHNRVARTDQKKSSKSSAFRFDNKRNAESEQPMGPSFRFENIGSVRKKITKISLNTLLAIAIIILLSTLIMTIFFNREDTFLFGYKPYIIDSGSMEPEFKKNSMVIIKKVAYESIEVGDVIAFKARQIGNRPAFHRVIEITDEGYVTQGDNVDIKDDQIVDGIAFLGKKVWATNITVTLIPLIKTPRGFIFVIVFPILGIILLVIFVKVARKLWKNRLVEREFR